MSRMSEDALKRGLEAANVRIASLEKQLAFYKEKASRETKAKEEAKDRFIDVVKKIEKKAKKD